jgi:hypothetical protein
VQRAMPIAQSSIYSIETSYFLYVHRIPDPSHLTHRFTLRIRRPQEFLLEHAGNIPQDERT